MSKTEDLPAPSEKGPLVPGGEIDEAAADLLRSLTNEPAKAVGGVLVDLIGGTVGDRLRQWRNRNLINGLHKTAELLREKGISAKQAQALPNGELYAMFENMSKQEHPELSGLWAGLLANSANPNSNIRVEAIFVEKLKSIDTLEAAHLEYSWAMFRYREDYNRIISKKSKKKASKNKSSQVSEEEKRLFGFQRKAREDYKIRTSGLEKESIKNSILTLIDLDLVAIPILPSRYYDRYDRGLRESFVDGAVLAEFLDPIENAIEILSGLRAPPDVKGIFDPYPTSTSGPDISLTTLGHRLMIACH